MVDTNSLSNAYIQTEQSGDIASGSVILVYQEPEELVVEVRYDTIGTPDGLTTTVTDHVGDDVRVTEGDLYEVELTEKMREHATETFSHYYSSAVSGEGATPSGGVIFTGIVGADDGWLPTDN